MALYMYIHFRDGCLKSFDEDTFYGAGDEFGYNRITVDEVTADTDDCLKRCNC